MPKTAATDPSFISSVAFVCMKTRQPAVVYVACRYTSAGWLHSSACTTPPLTWRRFATWSSAS